MDQPSRKKARRIRRTISYSDEEREQIVNYVLQLKKRHIQKLLAEAKLKQTGTKDELRSRIQQGLDEGALGYRDLVEVLDEIQPWGKQHVVLKDGMKSRDLKVWRDPRKVKQLLAEHELERRLSTPLPLILPPKMQVSAIEYDQKRLRVTAVARREGWERSSILDEAGKTEDGDPVAYHAYIRKIARGLVAFEWDLISNTAFIQVTQLPASLSYEKVMIEFQDLVGDWLDLEQFASLPLSRAITRFQFDEERKTGNVRSHRIDWDSPGGRTMSVSSPSAEDSVIGEEAVIDDAMRAARKEFTGRAANLYMKIEESEVQGNDESENDSLANFAEGADEDEVHVILFAKFDRINFPTANGEATVRHVLQRVRDACK